MIIATVIIAIFAGLAFFISLGNVIYLVWRNHWKSVDFFVEIKLLKKEDERVHGDDEEVNLYLVNKGCPITLLSIYFDQGNDTFNKMHVDLFPARLERDKVLKIPVPASKVESGVVVKNPKQDFPVNREKISDEDVHFYVVDSFENKYEMKRIFRKAHPEQPKVSKSDKS